MRRILLLLCISSINCKVLDNTSTFQSNERSLLDWIIKLVSPSTTTTTTTIRPILDPPDDCPSCQCGIARTRRRIVGGHETRTLEFPWMAMLLYSGRFYCGGTVINDLYVMTAAHCTAGFRKERITVRFLEHDRSEVNETKTVDRKVEAIIRHWRYSPGTYDNDIALLKLSERIDLSSALKRKKREGGEDGTDADDKDVGVRPVCLPTSTENLFSNYSAVVAGWGTTEEGGTIANILQKVNVPIMSNDECRLTEYKNRITDNMLCAGDPNGGKDACQGDSGGPLHVYSPETAQYQEVGIVSWGYGCARPSDPGVYTRTSRYLSWIRRNTRDACICD